ncbi:ClpXP protease specificity-enhancing factor [Oligella urethralis]|uniref:ClpXP protease specificity-enhancing factor n=1 Tax=Oligella urethralis TaxID=90245 RepID=UPI00288AB5B3|nr:ClpXP protease specificity-enhancing factor [Oligella urethralis]
MFPASSKPYLIRALYEWCYDQSLTPHIVARVDKNCQVPKAFVKDGYITFNVGPVATKDFHVDNHWVSFSARFGGQAQEVMFPVATVVSFFARETQEGMGFPFEEDYDLVDNTVESGAASEKPETKKASILQIIK